MLAATVLSLALSLLSLKNDHPWLAYVLVAFGSLTMLSTVFRKLEFYARSLVYVAGMGVVAFTGVFTSIFMALIGQRASAPWLVARLFYKSVGPLVGVKFRIEGQEYLDEASQRPTVLVGNHQTMFDILYLGAAFPKRTSIMAKKELKWTPFLGQFMLLSNAVFVDRANRQKALSTFQQVAQTMKQKGTSLFIFVEGTRNSSPTPSLLPFKKGAFHLAVEAQCDIIPIVCENYHELYSPKQKWFKSGEIVLKALPPISAVGRTSSSEDIAALSLETRNAMIEAIEGLSQRSNSLASQAVRHEAAEDETTPLRAGI